MIKLMHIISDTNIGGAGRLLLNHLEHRSKTDFDVTVVLPPNSKLRERVLGLGVRVIEMNNIADKSFDRNGIGAFVMLFKSERPDIIHTHACMTARVAARLVGKIKIVVTRHTDMNVLDTTREYKPNYMGSVVNNLLVDRVIVVAHALKQQIGRGVPDRKIDVVLNGSNPVPKLDESEIAAFRASLGLPDGACMAGIIARVNVEKGLWDIVEAAKVLNGSNTYIVWAGTGADEDELKATIKRQNLKNLIMAGFMTNVGLFENAMDIQINASYAEACSLSLIEGMSLGKPAVATDVGGNPYLIQDGVNGLIVKMKDGRGIAEAIKKMWSNRELYSKMSDSAVRIYNERFSGLRCARETEAVYKRLMS